MAARRPYSLYPLDSVRVKQRRIVLALGVWDDFGRTEYLRVEVDSIHRAMRLTPVNQPGESVRKVALSQNDKSTAPGPMLTCKSINDLLPRGVYRNVDGVWLHESGKVGPFVFKPLPPKIDTQSKRSQVRLRSEYLFLNARTYELLGHPTAATLTYDLQHKIISIRPDPQGYKVVKSKDTRSGAVTPAYRITARPLKALPRGDYRPLGGGNYILISS